MDARIKIAATFVMHRRLVPHRRLPRLRGGAAAARRDQASLQHTPRLPAAGLAALHRLPRSSSSSSRSSSTPETCRNRDYLWRWGILSVSTEGLYTAGIIALRVILLYYVTTMLMLTTSLVDLTNGLELILGPLQRLRVPVNELVLVFVIAIKFVPIFIEEIERLARAQTARGVPFDEGGAIKRARRLGRLLVPIFIGGFARADILTTAMNTRSYRGGRRRTKFRQMRARPSDWLVLALVIVWTIAAWIV